MMIRTFACAAALAASATPALAAWQAAEIADPYGAGAITRGSYDGIERRLSAAYLRGDRTPEVLLNLAAIRIKQQDLAGAQRLYREVMVQPNVDLTTPGGTAWSHAIAERGLRLGTAIASR